VSPSNLTLFTGYIVGDINLTSCMFYNNSNILADGGFNGGLIGAAGSNAKIDSCKVYDNVVVQSQSGGAIGGLIGEIYDDLIVINSSVVNSTVATLALSSNNIGGLVGSIDGGSSTFDKSYVNNSVITGDSPTGGIYGYSEFEPTYANAYYSDSYVSFTNAGPSDTQYNLSADVFDCWANGMPEDLFVCSFTPDNGYYLIEDMNDFLEYAQYADKGYNFRLEKDINLASYPDFNISKLVGTFDGNGYTISNLDLEGDNENWGLFREAENATIKNLNIENFNVSISTGDDEYAGALIGYGINDITIENVNATNVYISATQYVGGLVGGVEGNLTIESSEITEIRGIEGDNRIGGLVGRVTFADSIIINNSGINDTDSNEDIVATGSNIGGLAGYLSADNEIIIENSYIVGDFEIESTGSESNHGGLVGYIEGSSFAELNSNYLEGNIIIAADGENYVGGLVGYSSMDDNITIDSCYLDGNITIEGNYATGGLIGYSNNDAYIYSSYLKDTINISADEFYTGGLIGYVDGNTEIYSSYLDSDITIDGSDYTAGLVGYIGSTSIINSSHLDGNINISGNSNCLGGLVGYTEADIEIYSSYLDGDIILGDIDDTYVGGLLGYTNYYATIEDSYLDGTINITLESGSFAGGLIGIAEESYITDSYIDGTIYISSSEYVGGLIGDANDATISNSHVLGSGYIKMNDGSSDDSVGGLVGEASYLDVDSSYVKGNLDIEGYRNIGGIIGGFTGSNDLIIDNSYVDVNKVLAEDLYAGGLVGYSTSSTDTITIEDSYFKGEVYSQEYSGGIGGRLQASNDINLNDVYVISDRINATNNYAGGLVGDFGSGGNASVTDSYFEGSLEVETSYLGGLLGYVFVDNMYVINNSYADLKSTSGSPELIGGLVGYTGSEVNIANSHAKIDNTNGTHVGGLIGGLGASNSVIEDSYAIIKTMTGTNVGMHVGAIAADVEIKNSFAYSNTDDSQTDYIVGNLAGSISLDNVHYYSLDSDGCYYNGSAQTDVNCTKQTNEAYFYYTNSSPIDTWDFTNSWKAQTYNFPALQYESDNHRTEPSDDDDDDDDTQDDDDDEGGVTRDDDDENNDYGEYQYKEEVKVDFSQSSTETGGTQGDIVKVVKATVSLSIGKPVDVKIEDEEIAFEGIKIESKVMDNMQFEFKSIKTDKIEGDSIVIDEGSGKTKKIKIKVESSDTRFEVYDLLEVKTNFDNNKFEKVGFSFKVSKDWLNSKGYDKEEVFLVRYTDDGKAIEYKPELDSATSTHYKYSVETEGFSTYAVVAKTNTPILAAPVDTTDVDTPTIEVVDQTPDTITSTDDVEDVTGEVEDDEDKESSNVGLIILIIAIIVGVVIFIMMKNNGKKPKIHHHDINHNIRKARKGEGF
jgi:PGF-pre-PGF domain-containing protein